MLANRPKGEDKSRGVDILGNMKKSDSIQSMDWDSIIESARKQALAPDRVPANSQSIELVSRIEDDEVAYKEEFLEEQEEKKRELVESLALQRTNSLSARFRRQRSKEIEEQEQEQQVEETKTDNKLDLNDISEVNSRRSSAHSRVSVSEAVSGIEQRAGSGSGSTSESGESPKKKKSTAQKVLTRISSGQALLAGLKKSSASSNDDEGTFNFKARLKKTNVDPEKSPAPKPDDNNGQIDYRSVLKKRGDNKEAPSKRIIAKP